MKTRYPLKLQDEVYVAPDTMRKVFRKKSVFVVGYGSLLFEDGWRNRGMDNIVTARDLKECRVHGYKRGPFGMIHGVHFYGAIPDESAKFNAVMTQVHNQWDWEGLMQTEMIAGMFRKYNYRVVDITKLIEGVKLPKNAVVHMVANESLNERRVGLMRPSPGYYKYVWKGVQKERSPMFIKEFLATGGMQHWERSYVGRY